MSKYLLSFSLLTIVLIFTKNTFAGYTDCHYQSKNCLCPAVGLVGTNKIKHYKFDNITPIRPSSGDLKNSCSNARLNIYFDFDSYKLETNDTNDIYSYVKKNWHAGAFKLEGFASSSGNYDYNMKLGNQRMASVLNYIQRIARKPYRYTGGSYGEGYADRNDEASDRKVKITPISDFVSLLDLVKTDFYLYDQSGSMSTYWPQIQNYKHHKRSVRIYTSTTLKCSPNRALSSIYPNGGTNIWWSFWNLIDKMSPGESITIVSDFDVRPRLTANEWERIKRKLANRGVKLKDVHFVQIKGASVMQQISTF